MRRRHSTTLIRTRSYERKSDSSILLESAQGNRTRDAEGNILPASGNTSSLLGEVGLSFALPSIEHSKKSWPARREFVQIHMAHGSKTAPREMKMRCLTANERYEIDGHCCKVAVSQ
jgi:hypothetical protein